MKDHLRLFIMTISILSIVSGCAIPRLHLIPPSGGQYTPQNPSTTPEIPSTPSSETSDITKVREQVIAVEQIVNNVQRKGTYIENLNTYHEMKQQIKQVAFDVEIMEDKIEASYRTGTLDTIQFWQLKNELDNMEDRLDFLEDSLEFRLGVDD